MTFLRGVVWARRAVRRRYSRSRPEAGAHEVTGPTSAPDERKAARFPFSKIW